MTVSFSARALDDFREIGDAIATADKVEASRFLAGLWDACEGLSVMPLRYPLIPRRENDRIRRRPYGNYLIFYIVEDDDVMIARILHGARDYERLLFPLV